MHSNNTSLKGRIKGDYIAIYPNGNQISVRQLPIVISN